MNVFILLGKGGVVTLIGLMVFFIIYKYSQNLFSWIELQTYGTKDYVMKQLEFLHIEVKEEHIVYALIGVTAGNASLVFALFALAGKPIPGMVMGSISAIIGWKIPRPLMDFLVERRVTKYGGQMVDALNLMSNGLRAGLSVPQSIAMVVNELPAPISQEFNIILQQNKIGSPLEECFDNLGKRIPTDDTKMFVTSVNILKETGGNLAETFDTISSVIRERVRLKQKIETYTAQGMMQGGTIFSMPFAMGLLYYLSDPKSMEPMFSHPLGLGMLVLALGFNLSGGYVILKIVKIKI